MSARAPEQTAERRGSRAAWWGAGAVLLGLLVLLVPAPDALLGQAVLRNAFWLVRTAMLLLMPGLAVLLWLRPLERLDAIQRLCLAPLVSLALLPLLLFWVGVVGGAWSAAWVRLFLAVCTALVVWRLVGASLRHTQQGRALWIARLQSAQHEEQPASARPHIAGGVALGVVFILALGVRLYMIRGIPYPAWVDSYQHTIITQLILDTGRVPANYQPYADLGSFVYHFGYHAYSAFVGWVTGMPAHRAVLWGGQVLNALTVPSVFLLVDRLARDRRAALVAAVVVGLFSRMPAFYVNWGRYPQLAGQVLLPAAIVLTVEAVAQPRWRWRSALVAALLIGGLGLTHYRITVFYLAALVVLVFSALGAALLRRPGARAALPQLLLRLIVVGAAAALLIAPWLPALLTKTVSTAQQVLAASDGSQYDYITLDFVTGYGLRPSLLIAMAAAALWAIVRARRRPLGLAVLLWLGLITFLANPVLSGMPSGFMPNGTVIIALYLPAALLIGLAAGDLYTLLETALARRRLIGKLLALGYGLALAALAGWGTYWLGRTCIDPWRYLVSLADVQAMAWVQANTPADATFAVGGDFWLESGVSGHDAGLWLPYTARRRTLVPPVIYISEGDPGYVAQTASELALVYGAASPQALAEALTSLGAGYVYQSNRTPQPWQAHLEADAYFERLYDVGGVRVYRVLD